MPHSDDRTEAAGSRLGINGSFLVQPRTGVQRYATELTRALTAKPDRSFEIVVLVPPGDSNHPPGLGDRCVRDESALPLPLWVQLKLPLLCRRNAIDLLWSPGNMGPLAISRQLLTLHDASPFVNPHWFSFAFGTYTRLLWPRLGRRVQRVITDSEFSRGELARFGIAEREDIRVVPCGVSEFWSPPPRPEPLGEYGDFVLTLGGGNPRKNVAATVHAWRLLDHDLRARHRLVVIGGGGGAIFADDGVRGADDIIDLLGIDDPTLAKLYSAARVFLYPSLYEGFGLPPLEAMACGAVCVVSNSSSLPEVFGDSVLYCDPLQPASIAGALEQALTDEDKRTELRRLGAEQVDRYRWSESATQLAAIIESELFRT